MNVKKHVEPRPYTAEQLELADNRIRRTCFLAQRGYVFDEGRRISLVTGRGAGKSAAQLMRMVRAMMHRVRANCLYIASTRESAERLAWNELKRIIVDSLRLSGVMFHEAKLVCTLPNGSRLQLFGADGKDDINRLRGITYHEVGVDETASIKIGILQELLIEVLGPRMIGTLALLGTPGKQLDGMFFEATSPAMAGVDSATEKPRHRPWNDRELPEYAGWEGWSSHAWNIKDGVDAGIAAMAEIYAAQLLEKRRHGWSDSNPYWLREYMGVWVPDDTASVYQYRPHDDEGNEFNEWSPKRDSFGFAVLPPEFRDWDYGIGVDIGWKDAFALEVFAFSPSDTSRTLYHVYEIYTPRIYARKLAEILVGEKLNLEKCAGVIGRIGWPVVMVGDFARGGGSLLKELAEVYGITIAAADKPYHQKESSIELANSTFYEGRIKIMKGSHLAEELIALQWVVDQYGKRMENKSQNNHACDAMIYLRDALAPLLPAAGPSSPPVATASRAIRPRDEDMEPVEPEPDYRDADAMYDVGEMGYEY